MRGARSLTPWRRQSGKRDACASHLRTGDWFSHCESIVRLFVHVITRTVCRWFVTRDSPLNLKLYRPHLRATNNVGPSRPMIAQSPALNNNARAPQSPCA